MQQGHNKAPKAGEISIRINFSALLFAIISDKSHLEDRLILGAGLRACRLA